MNKILNATTPLKHSLVSALRVPERVRRIGFSEKLYGQVMDFLIDEAQLLDENRVLEWVELLAPDILYWMPVRQSVYRKSGAEYDPRMAYFFDTLPSIQIRANRTKFENAYAEDPPTRTRRLITNMVLHETQNADEFAVDTSFLFLRNRTDDSDFDQLSGRREDLIRLSANGWQLSQRTILIDQTVLRTPNLGVFL